jgi:hypothetical protein
MALACRVTWLGYGCVCVRFTWTINAANLQNNRPTEDDRVDENDHARYSLPPKGQTMNKWRRQIPLGSRQCSLGTPTMHPVERGKIVGSAPTGESMCGEPMIVGCSKARYTPNSLGPPRSQGTQGTEQDDNSSSSEALSAGTALQRGTDGRGRGECDRTRLHVQASLMGRIN